MQDSPHSVPAPLSNADIAVLSTLRFQKMMDSNGPFDAANTLKFPRNMLRPIRPHVDPSEEEMLTSGPCRVQIWDAPGDGSFSASGAPVVATGLANQTGVAFAAGTAIGSMAANAFGASRARKDAVPRWMDWMPQGTVTVSTHAVYLEHPQEGLLTYPWDWFDGMEMKAPSCAEITILLQDASARTMFTSDWTELIFVSWVAMCFPQHPGKYNWIPPGWRERIQANLHFDPLAEPTIGQ